MRYGAKTEDSPQILTITGLKIQRYALSLSHFISYLPLRRLATIFIDNGMKSCQHNTMITKQNNTSFNVNSNYRQRTAVLTFFNRRRNVRTKHSQFPPFSALLFYALIGSKRSWAEWRPNGTDWRAVPITEWPKKVRTPSVLFIHNHILLKSALKEVWKLYKVSNKSSNVSIVTLAYN